MEVKDIEGSRSKRGTSEGFVRERLQRPVQKPYMHSAQAKPVPLPTERGAGSPGVKAPLFAQAGQLAAVDIPLVEVVGPVPGH